MEPPGENSTFAERLKWVRDYKLREGTREFARGLQGYTGLEKVTHKRVTDYEGGRVPSSDYLGAVARYSGVNPRWLLLGEGSPDAPAEPGEAERALVEMFELVDRYRESTAPDAGSQRIQPGEAGSSLPPQQEEDLGEEPKDRKAG